MSDDTRFKILTDFMMKSLDEDEEEGSNHVETDRASGGKNVIQGKTPVPVPLYPNFTFSVLFFFFWHPVLPWGGQ